ncbi:MAG: type VI secretion system tip protein TssI/VgrG [Polyangiaceae bacterium]
MGARNDAGLEARLEAEDFDCERLQVSRVVGVEKISKLYRYEIFAASLEPEGLDVGAAIGRAAALVFIDGDTVIRRVSGMIAEATDMLDSETAFTTYRLVLVPRAFQLTLVDTQEIYVDTSIPKILEAKAHNVGLADDCELRLLSEYTPREYVVQFGETDLALISRLTEHLGVSFFFEQKDDRDHLVFTDHVSGFRKVAGAETAPFRKRGDRNGVFKLEYTTKVIPGLYAVSDYDYEKPQVDLTSTSTLEGGFGGGVIEWGSNFKEPKDGVRLAQVRTEERLVDATVLSGKSSVCTFTAGARVLIEDHPRVGEMEVLITEVRHEWTQAALASGVAEQTYENTFRAIPANLMYRPPRVTPRPRIHGVMSGLIDTPPGVQVEHAWIDSQGRYLVRVLFDTAPPGERKASLPIRMAQAHSGPNYGIHHPLRPGTEVLLAFVGGDPDRPIIIGSAPNGVTPTPVVDADHTLHRVRTWSGVLVEIDDGG